MRLLTLLIIRLMAVVLLCLAVAIASPGLGRASLNRD